ncbi:MAG: phosphate ABC transporter substrate-binding protein [Merismopedia sp. SIO2A8]|nr:phosphate ABC transporter substrate-binding protein [Merismopedia sp. SIO2A8]
MAQKSDTPILIAALVITLALLGGGGWWLAKQLGSGSNVTLPGTSPTPQSTPNGQTPEQVPAQAPSPPAVPLASTFTEVLNVPTGTFNYGGSTTWAPIRRDIDPLITQAHPSFQLQYTNPFSGAPGSSTGIQMLLDNQLAFVQSSRSLKPEEIQIAQQRGFSLREIPVAVEGIAIAVHPDLTVPGLTLDQLQQIYTGQLTNWNQVGGPNRPITPYSRRLEDGGTVEFFVDTVLEGIAFGSTVQFIPTTTEALRTVSADPGGIYYASAPEIIGQCTTKPLAIGQTANQLVALHKTPLVPPAQCPTQRNQINPTALLDGSYPITRQLLVIIKDNGQVEQQAGEAYAALLLSQQGQALLTPSGFVSIR